MATATKATTHAVDSSTVGTVAWGSPGNVTANDATFSTALYSGTKTATTHYLYCDTFGFDIPYGAIINGIVAGIHCKSSASSVGDYCVDGVVKLIKADSSLSATDNALASHWDTVETDTPHGSSTDLWGETWTPANINSSAFGMVLSVLIASTSFTMASVDYIYITVYYTPRIPRNSSAVYQNPCII
jgi:hypothetical protein